MNWDSSGWSVKYLEQHCIKVLQLLLELGEKVLRGEIIMSCGVIKFLSVC